MAAGEAGVVQAIFAADSAQFLQATKQVDQAIEHSTQKVVEAQETTASSNRKRVAAQQAADRAIFESLATETEKELSATREAFAKRSAALEKYGADKNRLTALQLAQAQRVGEIERGELTKTSAVMKSSHESSVHHLGQTTRAVDHLTNAFGASSGEAGKMAGAMGHLFSAGLDPVIAATALLALTIGTVIEKQEQQAEATRKATEAYREQQKTIFEWQAKVEALRAGTRDAEERGLQKEIEQHEALIKKLKEEEEAEAAHVQQLIKEGGHGALTFHRIAAESEARQKNIATLEAETNALRHNLFQVTVNKEAEEKAAEAVKQHAWEQMVLKSRNEEAVKAEERVATAVKKTAAATRELIRDEEQRYEVEQRLARATRELELQNERDPARLRELQQQQELTELSDHYSDLIVQAKGFGEDTAALEEQVQARAQAIRDKYLVEQKSASAEAVATVDKVAESVTRGADRWHSYAASVDESSLALRSFVRAQERGQTTVRVNDGRGFGTANPSDYFMDFARRQSEVAMRAAGGGNVFVLNAASDRVGVQAARDGKDWVVHVAQDIQNGGLIDQTIRARFPSLQPAGVTL